MYLKVSQTSKKLYSATFEIIDSNNNLFANVNFNGDSNSKDAIIDIKFSNQEIRLSKEKLNLINNIQSAVTNNALRKYSVYKNYENYGSIAINNDENYENSYKKLIMYGKEFCAYFIGLGPNGVVSPIYEGNKQIGEIQKKSTTTNGLHEYEIKIVDNYYIIPAIIHTLYLHLTNFYEPGSEIIQGVSTKFITTNDNFSKEKYNPNFWKQN